MEQKFKYQYQQITDILQQQFTIPCKRRMIDLYTISLVFVVGYSLFGWLIPLGIKINYGRLKDSISKLDLPPKFSWFFMEAPNLLWAVYFLFLEEYSLSWGYSLFIIHYFNRTIIYPLRLKTTTPMPLEIMLAAFSFTSANGYLQGISNISAISNPLPYKILGTAIFFLGMWINIRCDNILQAAKQRSQPSKENSSKSKYVLINDFLFKYVGSPNYFGEIIEWFGYFIACGTFESSLFVFSTFSILTAAAIPRNKWNKKNIEGYPADRKCIIPFVI